MKEIKTFEQRKKELIEQGKKKAVSKAVSKFN